jgi:hypothetical protein
VKISLCKTSLARSIPDGFKEKGVPRVTTLLAAEVYNLRHHRSYRMFGMLHLNNPAA